jgi:amidohydrolase
MISVAVLTYCRLMAYDLASHLDGLIDRAYDTMVDLRHDLHQHPELSNQEVRTTNVITTRMRELGWNQEYCPTDTGAVFSLDTGRPGKTVMVRADIDGLPVSEERPDVAFHSTTEGAMHACGHDVHTASLLGLADVLASRADSLSGRYVALFQPAEEGLGGARAMIEGGVLSNLGVDFAIGAHVTSLGPVGIVAARPGIIMSEASGFSIGIKGKGGHGAMSSHDGNVVLAVSWLAQMVANAVSELNFEGTDCACSAGVIHAGTANNVVPRSATLRGTLRTFTPEQKAESLRRLESMIDQVSREYSVTCEFSIDSNTPVVDNDPLITERVEASAKKVVGGEWVWRIPPASPSDDMSEFLKEVPGAYIFVGGALGDGTSGMHHSPDFAVADESMKVMASVLGTAAVDLAQG